MNNCGTPENWDSDADYLMRRIVRQAEICEPGLKSQNPILQELAANASAAAFFYAGIAADVRGAP